MDTIPKEWEAKEAFCLMLYRCEGCKTIEVLWNSRKNVTPFIIGCQQCDDAMQHAHFQLDVRKEDFKPDLGQRVFVDAADVRKYVARTIQEYVTESWDSIEENLHTKISKGEYIRRVVDDACRAGQPYCLRWEDYQKEVKDAEHKSSSGSDAQG